MNQIVLILALCLLPARAGAGAPLHSRPADGGLPGEWLTTFSAGARDAGLGNASTALTGAAAAYANPAGIGASREQEVVLMVAPLFAAGGYQAVSVSYPISDYDSIALNFLHLGSGAAEKTDALGQSVGNFDAQDYAFQLSYAQHTASNGLAAGLTLKAVKQSVAEFSATGFGIDLGIQVKPLRDLTLGLAVLNVLPPKLKLKEEKAVFPVSYRAGAAYDFSARRTFLLCLDAVVTEAPGRDRVVRPGAGLELRPLADDMPLLLRLGVNRREYTLGFSVAAGPVSFDYAAAFHELETMHRFGLTLRYQVISPLAEKKQRTELLKNLKQEARDWLAAANYAQCERTLQRILELDSSDSDAPLIAVEMQKQMQAAQIAQRQAEAQKLEQQRQAEFKAQAAARFNEAKGLYLARKYQAALEMIGGTLPLLKDNLQAQGIAVMSQAHLALAAEDYPAAMEQLRKAVELDPDNREALLLYKRVQDITDSDKE